MSSEINLIEVLKSDINTILEHITQENHPILESFIRTIEPLEKIYFIEYDIFESLLYKYCYDIDNQNYDPVRGFVPENKLKLFRDVFLEDMDFSSRNSLLSYQHGYYYSEERLYNLLFYHIFIQFITIQPSVEVIFNQALQDWKSAFENSRMPICIDLLLNDTFLIDTNEVIISDELKLKHFRFYVSLTGSDLSRTSENFHALGVILRLYTYQSFNHNFYGGFIREPISMNDPEFREEFQNELNKIREFVLSFYLNDFNAYLKGFEIYYPWWIGNELKTYDTSSFRLEQNRLTSQNVNQTIELHKKIHEHNILQDDELELALFNYYELHDKSLIYELILFDFMILENIFTRGSKAELSFRLALNLSLFISSTRFEMTQLFEITNKLYEIRSKIIHGGEWYRYLRRRNIPALLGLDSNTSNENLARAVHNKLLSFINRSLKKIIRLKIEKHTQNNSYEIMSDFTGLYFLINSSLFQDEGE